MTNLPDIQSSTDDRKIAIDRVGVTDVAFPIWFQSDEAKQHTVASFDMMVSLSKQEKGTHMSRFLQLLGEWDQPFSVDSAKVFGRQMVERLQAERASLTMRFPYFVDRFAPVTRESGKIRLDVIVEVTSGEKEELTLTVAGPATSLCPCSKQISDRGAHNQRCEVRVSARFAADRRASIEELFEVMENSASTQVFPVLKRPDEKWVTEDAYDHPKFVEDIVRDLALALSGDERLAWFKCSSENYESIHQHNAYAEIESDSVHKIPPGF